MGGRGCAGYFSGERGTRKWGFFDSEEEVGVGPVLRSEGKMCVATKVLFLEEKGKKKRRKKARGREDSWLQQREPFHCR